MTTHSEPARLAASPEDYARFKLTKGRIEPWEDGIRLDPAEPNIEWWYFDSLLDNGAKLGVTFCTKDGSRPHQPLEPMFEIDLDLPDGRRLMKYGRFKAHEFHASKDGCDVRMGPYCFTGDLHDYTITAAAEDVSAEIKLVGTTESWRPETGHIVFGVDGEQFLAWVIAVPMGKVTATYRIGSEVHEATGMGYHDHNFMNQPYSKMGHCLDHWYWGRGQIDRYSFTTAWLTAGKDYGYVPVPLYMLARDGKVIADDPTKLTFSKSGSQIDEHTGVPFPDTICFVYQDGDTRYVVTYWSQKTIVSQMNVDLLPRAARLVAKVIRYPGGYLRLTGPVSLDRYQGDKLVEHYEETGSFEQNFFGGELYGDQ